MNEIIDLGKIELKAWKTYMSQDGLFDIFIGIMLCTLAVQAFYYNIWFTSFIFVGILVVTLGKILITTPRIGLVSFGNRRMSKQLIMMLGLLIVFLLMLSLYYLSASGNESAETVQRIAFPAFIATIFVIVAFFLDYVRLGIYGVLFASTEVLREVYGESVRDIAITVLGIFTLMVGFYIFIRFIKKYPLPEKEGI